MIHLPAHRASMSISRMGWIALFILLQILIGESSARAAWIVNPTATLSGDDIIITPASPDSAGSAWLDTPIDLTAGFDITLSINLGNRDANGADGLSIVLQNDPAGTAAVGDTLAGGEWVGIHGISPALAVEVDTYQNGVRGDPGCDHLGINEIRDAASLPDHAGAGPICAETGGANMEDGLDHTLRLLWNSATNTLAVYWDGVQRITYTNNIVADIFSGASSVWFGVVGSTGGAYNLQQFRAVVAGSQLAVSKAANPASVDPGDTVTYAVTLQNNSPITAFVTQIEDQLPAGFAYSPGTTTGLTLADPAISGQTLTWNGSWMLAPGQTAVISFQTQSTAAPGLYLNSATVRGTNFADATTGATAAVTVGSNLSTSTKGVIDLSGGNAEPGDALRYTVTLNETAGRNAAAVSVSDDIPTNVTGFTVTSIPPGATDSSTGAGTGANGTGRLQVTNITVPANGSAAIVFEATIDPAAPIGTTIDNTASVANPTGAGAAPAAPTVTVTNPSPPAAGSKPLYLYSNPGNSLSRTPPAAAQPEVQINGNNASATWTLTPALATALTINGDAGVIPVELYLRSNWFDFGAREMTVTLSSSSGIIGSVGPQSYNLSLFAPALVTFNIPVSGDVTLPPGDALELTISNSSGQGNRRIYVSSQYNGAYSRVVLEARTVINVDQVAFYDAAYPGGAAVGSALTGQTIYIRATVSDPFGSFDISSAALELLDALGALEVGSPPAAMSQVYDAGGASKIYEYAYALPGGGPDGIWTARVTAQEGSEGLVSHTGTGTVQVVSPPVFMLLKSAVTESDPINGTINPKAIPGAFVLYALTLSNSGGAATDSDSVILTDPVAADTALFVGDLGAIGSGPVLFFTGSTPSGLSYTFSGLSSTTDDVAFSNNGGVTFDYTPVPDANSCDGNVTHVRINPKGSFNGANGGNVPAFTLRFRVQVQ